MTLSMSSSARQFEQLVRRILEHRRFEVDAAGHAGRDVGFDFTAKQGNEVWAIEVKFYRTARAQVSLLESAASRLASRGITAGARKAMLVVSCQLPLGLRLTIEEKFSVTFVDRVDLLNWAARTPELLDDLNSLLESDPATTPESPVRLAEPTETSKPLPEATPPEDTKGTALCRELKALKRGKDTWPAYERLCDRILRYLFPNDLHGWHRQKRTDDALHRFDYVCRIRPTTDFWQFLVRHLDSRYILFEFKNYSGKIKQGQILTTRSTCLNADFVGLRLSLAAPGRRRMRSR